MMKINEIITESEKLFPKMIEDILHVVPEAEEIWFHGSRATGKHRRNSDWDILVIVDDNKLKDHRGHYEIEVTLRPVNAKYKNFDMQVGSKDSYGGSVEYWARKEGKLLWKDTSIIESIITESLKTLFVKDIQIRIDMDHLINRMAQRGLFDRYKEIDQMLRDLPALLPQIADIEPGHQFWLWDPKNI